LAATLRELNLYSLNDPLPKFNSPSTRRKKMWHGQVKFLR